MIAGIIVAAYFELLIRWLGDTADATLFDHVLMSAPQVFCLAVGAVYQWFPVRNKYGSEMLPAWFCKLLVIIPIFFILGNVILFTWLFVFGGINNI